MNKRNGMQLVRLTAMVLAIAGIVYALEFMDRRPAVWFWIGVLGIGFAGSFYTFRLAQRRLHARSNADERRDGRRRAPRSGAGRTR